MQQDLCATTQQTGMLDRLAAGQDGALTEAAAMDELCRAYWHPLYAYIRHRGHAVEEAQDLTQEFFARLLQENWLVRADRNKGRLRSFLLGALNHFLANQRRRSLAAKRGGGQAALLSLDDTAERRYAAAAASDLTPEKVYERQWALILLNQALERLRREQEVAGHERGFELLREFLSSEVGGGDYGRIGAQLGMSHGAVATAVHRLRHRYRELVREEIARTVGSPAELEDEMRALLAALS